MSRKSDLKEPIEQIEALTKERGFIYALSFLLMKDMFLDPAEAADIDWHDRLSFQEMTFLAGLLVKHEIDFSFPTEEECAKQVEEADRLFLELHKKHNERFIEQLKDDLANRTTDGTPEDSYRRTLGPGHLMTEPIFYSESGAYDFQYLEFAKQKYEQDKPWITQKVGIDVALMAQIAKELKKLHEQKFMKFPETPRSDFREVCKAALSIFCFKDKELEQFGTGEVKSFLEAFTLVPGTVNANLALPGQYNKIQSRPIVELPDRQYFLPVQFNLSQAIYESPFYWMNGDASYRGQALRHRGDFAQVATAQLMKSVFGDGNVHTEVQVRKTKKHTLTDIDVLAIAGNKAVIVQVKSKRLTEPARVGQEETLRTDFEGAIQDAYDQALLSRCAVIDKNSKLLVDGKELRLNECIDDAYILCVTLDHYPAVTHQVDIYLKKNPEDPSPIAISIFDLDILAFYLKDPFEFLYYLRQRTALHNYFKADSEMSLLGFHLRRKLFKHTEADIEILDNSHAQLIDANFPVFRGSVPKTSAADKLYSKWKNEEFQELVDQIKATSEPRFTDAIFFLYDIAGDGADKLIEMIKFTKDKTASDNQTHDTRLIYTESSSGITILSEPSVDKIKQKLLTLAAVGKYKSKADVWLALGCHATSPNLVDAMTFNKHPWHADPVLEELVEKHFRGRGKMVTLSGRKIQRNERCPCGSGKKFKFCHGR